MTWLITGASGQLGKSLVELLKAKGVSCVGFSKSDLDISSPESSKKILRISPSTIINCAAYTSVDRAEIEKGIAYKVNEVGAKNVALAARELEVPLIHISTNYVFSGTKNSPWKTTDITEPVSEYGKSKLEGERQIQKLYPEHSIILRTSWLYGPFGKNFAKTILKKALSTKDTIQVVNDQTGQPTSTISLAKQIYYSRIWNVPAGMYHVTNSGEATWYDFAREIVTHSGESISRVKPISSYEYQQLAKRPTYSVIDNSEWHSTSVQEMEDWKSALKKAYPHIASETERELRFG